MIKGIFFLNLLITLLVGCDRDKKIGLIQPDWNQISVGQKILYYEDSVVVHNRQELFLQNVSKFIGLPFLRDEKDGVHVRIWLWGDLDYIIDISQRAGTNLCYIIQFHGEKDSTNDYLMIDSIFKNLQPNSGWSDFFSKLKQYKILTMKSGTPYEKQVDVLTDRMSYVQFEVAQNNQYRFYEYLEPSYYRYVDTGSRNVYEFLEYFNQQMNVQVYKPEKTLFVNPK